MPTDAEWYRYVSGRDDSDLCAYCREEIADPDDLEGVCDWCRYELDEEN